MTRVHTNVPYPMLLQRIGLCVEKGIHPEIYFSADDLDHCQEQDVRRIAEVLQQQGLEATFHSPFMDLSPGGVDRRVKEVTIDRFSKIIELAEVVRPKSIVFHPGYDKWKFNGNFDLWLNSSLETWKPLVEEAAVRGLVLAIENVYEEKPDTLLKLLEEIHSPHFRLCFDTGHFNVFSRVPLSVWVDDLGPYFHELHLHDNQGQTDEHLPVGEGIFNFNLFFNLIRKRGIHPIYTIEPHEEAHLWRSLEAVKKYNLMDA